MNYKTIVVEQKDHIGKLYFNRPEMLNAMSDEMRLELHHFFQKATCDRDLRVLIVSGNGRAFSAGADLNVFKQRYETYRDKGQQDCSYRLLLPKALAAFPKPIIAAINGPAVGFGATMPLNCDIRIASTEAKFSFAFARLGVTPEFCSSYFLPRLIGFGQASELIYTARMIDAHEALRIGLVNRVVSPEVLLSEAQSIAEKIAAFPPEAVQGAKKLLRHGSHSALEQVLEYEAHVFQQATQNQAHYDAVCRILEEVNAKKNCNIF